MKTFIIILLLIVLSAKTHSQAGCDPALNSNLPPSPYIDGYLTFDGKGDFLRTSDINALEFPVNSTDSFSIECRLKISTPYRAMYILGKASAAGWIFGYHTNESGYVSIYINNEWKRIYFLGSDTTWHNYRINYKKSEQKLETIVDGEITNTYNNFTYTGMANNAAFSVGNVGFFPQYGIQTVNLPSLWFKGSIASLIIRSNSNIVVNYGFNEGGGQVARDSAAYFYSDRTYPGSSTCGATHFMLGFMPSEDTCDPSWSAFDVPVQSRFSPLGQGTQFWYSASGTEYYAEHFSMAMTTWNGYLVNTGYFNLAGGNPARCIAKWDGNAWSPLGAGLNHEAQSVASYRNELYAAGFFDSAGGVASRYIARWNGSSWSPCGTGFDNIPNVMCVYNDNLIVGGWFTTAGGEMAASIASWDGTRWTSMNIGMNGPVYALKEYNGELYAGGNFYSAGTQTCNGIAKWNGSQWVSLGAGVSGGDRTVNALEVYNGELYAGGLFIKMDNISCYNIAKYNGTSWSALGTGAKGANCFVSQGYIASLKVCNDELYAAGLFTSMNGVVANKLAKFNGVSWCSVEYGIDLRPRAMEVYNDKLIINGDFYSASGVECNNIVSYDPPKNLTGTGNSSIPVKFSLEQNYPNPFNPKTKIKYNIAPNSGGIAGVRLVVYDITGKESIVLVNKMQTAGNYEIDFDGSSFASGIYIYRLETTGMDGNKLVDSRKMVLIK
ncbi:MAG: T9SS type A sorting domain-containing protein [Ignavibacteria bacterium]